MRHPRRWIGAYAVVTGLLAIAFTGAILTGPHRAVQRSDYLTYHTAARIVLEARGDCLYTVACQAQVQHELIGDEPTFTNGPLPFNSPPWLAALVAPFGALPLGVGFALFTLLSLALLALAAWRLAWGGAGTRLLAALLLVSAWPTVMGVIRGQSTLAAAGLLGLSVAASLAGRPLRAGAYLGLAALKPTLPILLAVRLIAERRRWTLIAAAAVLAGLVVLAFLIVSPGAVLEYPAYLFNLAGADGAAGVHVEQMINWRGAALRLGAEGSLLSTAGVIATIAAVAAAWWWARRSPRASALGAAVSLVATPLVIPHANQHEAILVALGILVAISALEEIRVQLVGAAIALQGLAWIGPLLSGQEAAWLLFSTVLACLALLMALAWRERTRYFSPLPVPASTD